MNNTKALPGAQRRTVDVSRLSVGVYMLHIVTDEGRTTHACGNEIRVCFEI
ncbi:MAG: hypothetical protein R2795_12035 [Saprospiraceae bacterium]